LDKRRALFHKVLAAIKSCQGKGRVLFGTDYRKTLGETSAVPEELKTKFGLSCVRRSNAEGYHYFISALKGNDTEAWIPLGVHARSAVLYNPMNGECGKARLRQRDGKTAVFLQLHSGESAILKTFTDKDVMLSDYGYWKVAAPAIQFTGKWSFHFVTATPAVSTVPDSVSLGSWTDLDAKNVAATMGTASYTTRVAIDHPADYAEWKLDLGDVRESARVRVNGKEVETLFALPYECLVGKYLHPGINEIEVEVTNLAANRIADMDRRGVKWRIFKDANIVDLNYKRTTYENWSSVPSGLLGPVQLIPLETE